MNSELVATLTHEDWKAEVYSLELPGEFKIVYISKDGKPVEEAQLTGISSYHQRESEILQRLGELAGGAKPNKVPELGDSGEYND